MGEANKAQAAAPQGGGGLVRAIALAAIIALCASGIGLVSGVLLARLSAPSDSAPSISPARTASEEFQVLTLPSIVTNLAAGGWIRLEVAVVVDGNKPVQGDLAARLAQDTTALLRSLSVRQISGPSGFLYLRQEILDRMKVRSSDRVREVMIQSLVIE